LILGETAAKLCAVRTNIKEVVPNRSFVTLLLVLRLSGVAVNALAFGPRGSHPGPATILPWASCLLTLPSQSSQLQETVGYKREYSDRSDLTA